MKLQTTNDGVARRHRDHIRRQAIVLHSSYSLSNKTTRLTAAFVGSIGNSTDIRYQLAWNFGAYLRDIPRRLGTSKALDAASDSLVTAHAHYCPGQFVANAEVLKKNSHALAMLRNDIDDKVQSRKSETLCAIMVIMITQVSTAQVKALM